MVTSEEKMQAENDKEVKRIMGKKKDGKTEEGKIQEEAVKW